MVNHAVIGSVCVHIYIYIYIYIILRNRSCRDVHEPETHVIATWPNRDNVCWAQMIVNVMKRVHKFKPEIFWKVTLQGLSRIQNCRDVRNDCPLAPPSGVNNIYSQLCIIGVKARVQARICCKNIFSAFWGICSKLVRAAVCLITIISGWAIYDYNFKSQVFSEHPNC